MATYLMRWTNEHRDLVGREETSTRFTIHPKVQWLAAIELVESSFTNLFNNIQYPNKVAVGTDFLRLSAPASFMIQINRGPTVVATIAAGNYTAAALVTAIQAAINAALGPGVITVQDYTRSFVVPSGTYVTHQLQFIGTQSFLIGRSAVLGFADAAGDPQGVLDPPGGFAQSDAHNLVAADYPLCVYFLGPPRDFELFLDYLTAAADLTMGLQAVQDNQGVAGPGNSTIVVTIDPITALLTISNTAALGFQSRFYIFGRGYKTLQGNQLTTAYQFGFDSQYIFPNEAANPAAGGMPVTSINTNTSMVQLQGPQEIYLDISVGGAPRLIDSDGEQTRIGVFMQNNAPRKFTNSYKVPDHEQQKVWLSTGPNPRSLDRVNVRVLAGPDLDELVADESMRMELVFRVHTTQVLEA